MMERIKAVRFYFYHPKDHQDPKDPTTYDFFGEIFGTHNLESAAEPEEMLCISRKSVQELYVQNEKDFNDTNDNWFAGYITALKDCFGNKCLPDELKQTLEQTSVQVEDKPKFKVGDKVKIVDTPNPMMRDEIGIIEEHLTKECRTEEGRAIYKVKWAEDSSSLIEEMYLEPYTEEPKDAYEQYRDAKADESRNLSQEVANCDKSEESRKNKQNLSLSDNQKTENMEEKELNLCQLLKGCEGETFYSRAYGEVRLNEIVRDDRPNSQEIKCYTPDPQSDRIWFLRDGRKFKNGEIDLYPSRALYEKYPLDARAAWQEWAAENIKECSIVFDYGVNGYPDVAPPRAYTFPNEEECKDFLREVDKAMEEIYNRRKEATDA